MWSDPQQSYVGSFIRVFFISCCAQVVATGRQFESNMCRNPDQVSFSRHSQSTDSCVIDNYCGSNPTNYYYCRTVAVYVDCLYSISILCSNAYFDCHYVATRFVDPKVRNDDGILYLAKEGKVYDVLPNKKSGDVGRSREGSGRRGRLPNDLGAERKHNPPPNYNIRQFSIAVECWSLICCWMSVIPLFLLFHKCPWHIDRGLCVGIRSFPGWLLSRMVFFPERRFPESRFPDSHFPGWGNFLWLIYRRTLNMNNTERLFVNGRPIMFNCSWRWSLTERTNCVYLNGFTVNSPH